MKQKTHNIRYAVPHKLVRQVAEVLNVAIEDLRVNFSSRRNEKVGAHPVLVFCTEASRAGPFEHASKGYYTVQLDLKKGVEPKDDTLYWIAPPSDVHMYYDLPQLPARDNPNDWRTGAVFVLHPYMAQHDKNLVYMEICSPRQYNHCYGEYVMCTSSYRNPTICTNNGAAIAVKTRDANMAHVWNDTTMIMVNYKQYRSAELSRLINDATDKFRELLMDHVNVAGRTLQIPEAYRTPIMMAAEDALNDSVAKITNAIHWEVYKKI